MIPGRCLSSFRAVQLAPLRHACGGAAAPLQQRVWPKRASLRNATVLAGHQQPLSGPERKAKASESQRLAAAKKLVTISLGKQGLSQSFLEGVTAALSANELVKIKVGLSEEGADAVIATLTEACDCVVVHKIGFTLTLYRQKGLPPPGAYAPAPAAAPAAAAATEAAPGKKAPSGRKAEVAAAAMAAAAAAAAGAGGEGGEEWLAGEDEESDDEDLGGPDESSKPPEFTVITRR